MVRVVHTITNHRVRQSCSFLHRLGELSVFQARATPRSWYSVYELTFMNEIRWCLLSMKSWRDKGGARMMLGTRCTGGWVQRNCTCVVRAPDPCGWSFVKSVGPPGATCTIPCSLSTGSEPRPPPHPSPQPRPWCHHLSTGGDRTSRYQGTF